METKGAVKMTPEQFCYWLQGFVELSANAPTDEQWKSVREHLQTVFCKVTPPVGDLGRYLVPGRSGGKLC